MPRATTLCDQLGLPASFIAKAPNPEFQRSMDWLPDRQSDVDRFTKLSLASTAWLTAGLVTVIAARYERLAGVAIPAAIEVRDQLLALQAATRKSELPEFAPTVSEDVPNDACHAVTRATNLGREIGRRIAARDDLGNVPYLIEGLRSGVLWVVWKQQAVYVFDAWYKRARRVVAANDKRTSPEHRFGPPIPACMLDQNLPVTPANFRRP